MITHKYRTVDVPVQGGALRVGVWDPISVGEGAVTPSVLAVHGVTASHLAWPLVVEQLPGVRVIAPDLRGRGASNSVVGASSMRAHASDLVAVLDAFGIVSVPVIGHSMGGFVSVVLSHVAPDRVDRLILVDGGVPLAVPDGVTPEALVKGVLGPTADRLSMRFANVAAYLEFWRDHPAFSEDWTSETEAYFAYDMVPAEGGLRSSTSLRTTTEDMVDLNTTGVLIDALAALPEWGRRVLFVTVPRGLQNEVPGLYPPEHLARVLALNPTIDHCCLDGLNHYTVVMGREGAAKLGDVIRGELQREPVGSGANEDAVSYEVGH